MLAVGGYAAYRNQSQSNAMAAAIRASDTASAPTEAMLGALGVFARTHLNASVSVTLSGAFARAQAKAKADAQAASANAQLYITAQKACSGRTDSVTQSRCVQDYVSKRLNGAPPATQVAAPQLADFTYRFVSPVWTTDIAGLCFLAAFGLLAGALVLRFSRNGRHAS